MEVRVSRSVWQTCRIFVSSTFDDMVAEREEIVKRVLPRLRTFGESVGVHVIGVDLRWGIQSSEQGGAHTVRRCLEAVDDSRPYFVGFVSGWRGWIPGIHDVDGDTHGRYPGLRSCVEEELSITELEILHAVHPLDGRVHTGTSALIFSRRNDAPISDVLQKALARRGIEISESSHDWTAALVVRPYARRSVDGNRNWSLTHGDDALADVVERDLRAWLSQSHPRLEDEGLPNFDDRVRAVAIGGTVPFASEVERLTSWIQSPSPILAAITGPGGIGKTTLLAQLATSLSDGPSQPLYRFIGYSASPVDLDDLLVPLIDQLETELQASNSVDEGRRDLLRRWDRAWHAAARSARRIPLLLDGLDSMPLDPDMLQWLFTPIRYGCPVVVSISTDTDRGAACLATLRAGSAITELPLAAFESTEARSRLVTSNLTQPLKELDGTSLAMLLRHPLSANPLFVSVVMSELKLHGRHHDVRQQLEGRLALNTEPVVASLLQRLESESVLGPLSEFSRVLLLGALAHSPSGLSTAELSRLLAGADTSTDKEELSGRIEEFLHHIRPFLQRRPHAHAFNSKQFADVIRMRHPVPPSARDGEATRTQWPDLLAELIRAPGTESDPADARAASIRRATDLPHYLRHRPTLDALATHLADVSEVVERIVFTGTNGLRADVVACAADLRWGDVPSEMRVRLDAISAVVEAASGALHALVRRAPTTADVARVLLVQAGLLGYTDLATALGPIARTGGRYAATRWTKNMGSQRNVVYARPIWPRLRLSADERWLAVVSDDSGAWLWSVEQQREIADLRAEGGAVVCAEFNESAKWLALGSSTGDLVQVDVATGRERRRYRLADTAIRAIAWIDDDRVCVGTADHVALTTWTDGDRREVTCNGVTALCTVREGSRVLAGDSEGALWVIDVNGDATRVSGALDSSRSEVSRIVSSADGRLAWALAGDRLLIECDLDTLVVSTPFQEFRPLHDIAVHPDGHTLAAANGVGELSLHDLQTRRRTTLKCVQNAAWSVVIGQSGRAYVAGQPERDRTPVVYVDLDGSPPDPGAASDPIFSVALSRDGRFAADAHSSGRLWMWDAATGDHLLDLEPRGINRSSSCAFTRAGKVMVVGLLQTVVLINTQAHEAFAELGPHGLWSDARFDGVRAIGIHPDDKFFVIGDSQGLLTSLTTTRYEALGLATLDSPPVGITVLRDNRVIVAEENGLLSEFDATLGQRITWPSPERSCWALAASATRLFTGHAGGGIARWSRDASEPPTWFAAHSQDVEALQLLDDDSGLASGGRDGHVRFWNLDTGSVMLDIAFPDAVENLSVSGDSDTLLVSLSRGGLVCMDLYGFGERA